MLNASGAIHDAFNEAIARFNTTEPMRRLVAGDFGMYHYKAILREVYHYTKEDPQMQSLVTVYFRGADRDGVKLFLRHATSEIGHEQLALQDLAALGENTRGIEISHPLPTTIALTAFPFYQICFRNPIGYLGYLYFLEFMPTQAGAAYMAALISAGVPKEATAFLHEHMTVDQGHNKLMQDYIARLVHVQADVDAVIYALRVTGHLYSEMLKGAMQQAEAPRDFGIDPEEACQQRV